MRARAGHRGRLAIVGRGPLPIQIINESRKQVILGNMKASVAADAGQLTNATTLVGAMDPGGYFPLDATQQAAREAAASTGGPAASYPKRESLAFALDAKVHATYRIAAGG